MIRRYFMTGLLVWVPLAVTVWILHLIVASMDRILLLFPEKWHTQAVLGFYVPGVGLVLTVLVIFVTGLLVCNFVGRYVLGIWEALLKRIPFVSSLYYSVKQVSDTLLSSSGQAFRKVMLVEYPRKGAWTLAFQTGVPQGELQAHLPEAHISLYIPTTPNPTSGFFIMMPKSEVIELEMSVETALKYIVSMGVVAPAEK